MAPSLIKKIPQKVIIIYFLYFQSLTAVHITLKLRVLNIGSGLASWLCDVTDPVRRPRLLKKQIGEIGCFF